MLLRCGFKDYDEEDFSEEIESRDRVASKVLSRWLALGMVLQSRPKTAILSVNNELAILETMEVDLEERLDQRRVDT